MAELASLLRPAASKLFLQKALLFMLVALILPLSPSQAPEFFTNHTLVNKIWELIHLLFIGLVISYGLFSRRNTETVPGKELGFEVETGNPNSYVSQILPGLDNKEEDEEEEGKVQQIWSNRIDASKPATVVDKPLFLPVRSLNRQTEGSRKDENRTVLPSPIPWRSRSGRFEVTDELYSAPKIRSSSLSSPRSKKPSPSPSPSLSRENSEKRKTVYKEIMSRPPVPPPPPPPFLGHAYQPPFADRKAKSAVRSFKDELKDVSMRPKPRPRTSFDGSSSFSPPPVAKSVRTFRTKEAQIEPPKKTFVEPRDEDTVERLSMSSDSDNVSDSTDSEFENEEEIEDYSDKEVIEKPNVGMMKVEEKKRVISEEEVNEVDKKADEFIAKFREQIRLQRIESIKRSAGERAVRSHKKVPRD